MKTRLRERWFLRWAWDGPRWMSTAGIIVGVMASLVALVLVVLTLVVAVEKISCDQKADRLNLPSSYKVFSGCWYELPSGEQVPDDRYPPKYIEVGGSIK